MKRVHIFFEGRVQGVSFRWWVQKQVGKLGLVGWVKNLADGRVEAVFEGKRKDAEKVIEECKKGPMLAKVKHIDVVWEDATGEFKNFQIVS